jgi:acetyltransferase
LLDFAEVFTNCALPLGANLGIVTRSGGAGVLMADRAEELGLNVAALSETTIAQLKSVVPAFGATANPVDVTAQGQVDPSIMRESLKIMLADPGVDVGVVWLAFSEKHAEITVRTFAEAKAQSHKPFVVSWPGIPDHALQAMHDVGIAVLPGAELAVDGVAALVRYAEARRHWQNDDKARAALARPVLKLPAAAGVVPTLQAAQLLQSCGINVARAELATTAAEAMSSATRLGYPVALKIESPDLPHKTEIQGVKLGLNDAAAVKTAFAEVTANAKRHQPEAKIDGVIVQRMAQGDVELVIGLKNDPAFGVVIMVGLGGIYVEVLKDIAFRTVPVTEGEAGRMLDELKSRAILNGIRGKPPADKKSLTKLISAVSLFGAAAGERLQELDLNPVLVGPSGAVAVDWLILLAN